MLEDFLGAGSLVFGFVTVFAAGGVVDLALSETSADVANEFEFELEVVTLEIPTNNMGHYNYVNVILKIELNYLIDILLLVLRMVLNFIKKFF